MISENILKEKKIKITKQRIKVLDYIIKNKTFSLKELVKTFNEIDQSTIYRMLLLFENNDIIIKNVINHEIIYTIKNHHHHFIECVLCHKKEELDICPYNFIDLKGFKINDLEKINGLCSSCQEIKYGIFVGSFNPPTNAHFDIGHNLINDKIIDKVVYVPCNSFKKKDLVNIKERYNMLNLYIKNYSYMSVSDIEIRNKQDNFSYKEMDLLKEDYQGKIYIIIGADNLLNLSKWNNFEYLLNNYNFIVIKRFDIDVDHLIKEKYSLYQDKFIIYNFNSNISSTLVRETLLEGKYDNELCPLVINEYIKNNHIY